ncbi:MarR family transcriptional regulator [Microlunatus spumicola]|uniref:MarR family transcriptional regulator n=1 Tax=Microlunatus spumicola TaxID=81499 RepID=A0ABP6WHS9_9ACTN
MPDAGVPLEDGRTAADVEVALRAARTFSAITAESMAQAGDSVTLPQLRVLTLASGAGALNNRQVAAALGVHISNASRICDRLVQVGLLSRRDAPGDRRQVQLTITEAGTRLLDAVTGHRRTVLLQVLDRMTDAQRSAVTDALAAFTAAAEDVLQAPHDHLP